MIFFSLDRSTALSPSPISRARFIASWINELDDSPIPVEIDPLPLTSSRQAQSSFKQIQLSSKHTRPPFKQIQCKSATSPKPLQSNPNLCTRSALFPRTKKALGKRKFTIMNKQEQLVDQGSPRRSGRPKSPTKKILDNLVPSSASKTNYIKSVTAQHPVLIATTEIPLRTKSPVKSKQSSRKPKHDLRSDQTDAPRRRTMNNDDQSENNVFPKLTPVTFDPIGKTTNRTRSTSPNKKRAEMKFYDPSIVFLDIGSSNHPQEVKDFMLKFKSTTKGQAVIPEYFSVRSMTKKIKE